MVFLRIFRSALLVLPGMVVILCLYTSLSSRWFCIRMGAHPVVSAELNNGYCYAGCFESLAGDRFFQTARLDAKTLTDIKTMWDTQPHFLGFGFLSAGHGLGLIRVPLWFLSIVSIVLAAWLWRLTRPAFPGNAFPVEKSKPPVHEDSRAQFRGATPEP